MYRRIFHNVKELSRQIVYVPKHKPPNNEDIDILKEFFTQHKKILILTGAGISTESGIPDYRSEEVGLYARSNHKPVQYQEFVKYSKVRQRYWARNFVGWPRFSSIQPNVTHFAICDLEKFSVIRNGRISIFYVKRLPSVLHNPSTRRYRSPVVRPGCQTLYRAPTTCNECHRRVYGNWDQWLNVRVEVSVLTMVTHPKTGLCGKVTSVVTQNVDRLHQKAGSKNVIELHGSGYIVKCLKCPYEITRDDLQVELLRKNPDLTSDFLMIRPDGDVELSKEQEEKFKSPLCPECEGPLKPDIVFFGDNVPKIRVNLVKSQVSSSDALLVLGSSLTVFSSYRIILQAKDEKKKIAILNIGPTRADEIVDVKISTKCGDILPIVCSSVVKEFS